MLKKRHIANWGNYPKIEAKVAECNQLRDIRKTLTEAKTILARGNGRCYGDAALNEKVFSSLKLNKFLDFDDQRGILECQAGVLLSDILDFIVPKGWFLPVTPGTKFITLGGAVAADVHGKNHHQEGCFSEQLIAFELMDGKGEIHQCSKEKNSSLFWNTIGNMGLTGMILSVRVYLKKIETAYIQQETIKASNLREIMDLFATSMDYTYTVAWIDCLQKGKDMGRSILFRGEHVKGEEGQPEKGEQLRLKPKFKFNIPFYFPGWILNTLSVKAFNFLFYHKQFSKNKTSVVDYDTFFYPLDAILHWNRMYGKKGFTQYQLVLPLSNSYTGLTEILETIRKSGQGSFLTVLKLFGQNNSLAIHSFPIEGYTLSLDFKITKKLPALVKKLDEIVLKYDGKVYRAKDAFSDPRLSKTDFNETDPKFDSLQKRRLIG